MTAYPRTPARKAQSGAALIISLILLMVLTVLAISTMRTASLELLMAGNAQYRENAFRLAQSGIDAVMRRGDPGVLSDCTAPVNDPEVAVAELGGRYATTVCYRGESITPGNSFPRDSHLQLRGRLHGHHRPARCPGTARPGLRTYRSIRSMSEPRALLVRRRAAALAGLPLIGAACRRGLLGTASPAAATLRTIEQAYELTRDQVQLPGKPEGGLTVRPCPNCKPVVLRVTTATAWFIAPETVKAAGQPAVLAAFKASGRNPGTLVYVYYEPQTRRVKRIVLDLPAPGGEAMSRLLRATACALTASLLWVLAAAARADDAELFLSDPEASATRANVLFVIDTSGSMNTLVATQASFDSGQTFGGCYDSNALYFTTNAALPACDSPNVLPKAVNRCAASRQQLEQVGYYADFLLGWDTTRDRWDSLSPDRPGGEVECEGDRGTDGNGSASEPFAADGSEGPWAATDASEPAWTTQYTVYDGNWLNWRSNPPTVQKSRLDIVKESVNGLMAGLTNVNVGVMRFNGDEGGSVVAPIANIETSRAATTAVVNQLTPGGRTPLSETLYEAAEVFRGADVDYGNRRLRAERGRRPGRQHARRPPLPLPHHRVLRQELHHPADGWRARG